MYSYKNIWKQVQRKTHLDKLPTLFERSNPHCGWLVLFALLLCLMKSTETSLKQNPNLKDIFTNFCRATFYREIWSRPCYHWDVILYQHWDARCYGILKLFPDPHGPADERTPYLYTSAITPSLYIRIGQELITLTLHYKQKMPLYCTSRKDVIRFANGAFTGTHCGNCNGRKNSKSVRGSYGWYCTWILSSHGSMPFTPCSLSVTFHMAMYKERWERKHWCVA